MNEAFFLGGIDKGRVLRIFKPHIFFDDQVGHIEGVARIVPSVHVPFGITNIGRESVSEKNLHCKTTAKQGAEHEPL